MALVDQFCPAVHEAPITAADRDPISGAWATADARGVVAIARRGEASPGLVFQPGGGIDGALRLIRGGSLVAVGDEEGSVGVYRTDTGDPVFTEVREGGRGRVRAMRGMALSNDGSLLASVARDGLLRIWDIHRGEREAAWQGFGGQGLDFDERGDRVLALSQNGQPRLVDLRTWEAQPTDRVQMLGERVRFGPDYTFIICSGPAGVSLLRTLDGVMFASFASRGGSGIAGIVLSPRGDEIAAVTSRSTHYFSLPELQPVRSERHGAPSPAGAAIWVEGGVRVGGEDGALHDGGGGGGAPPVRYAFGLGDVRVAVHPHEIAIWDGDRRVVSHGLRGSLQSARVDRDVRYLVAQTEGAPLTVLDAASGRSVFTAGPESIDARDFAVGGGVVAAMLRRGGLRWWDLKNNRALQLDWPRAMCLSGSGTWMGVVTPQGAVRILDPSTGRDALHAPTPLADIPITRLAFVNRRPEMLILDADGVVGHYDLAEGLRSDAPAEGQDVIDFNVEVDGLWGMQRLCVVRLPQGATCSIVVVDYLTCEVKAEISGLHPRAEFDVERGLILEPAKAGAILERDLKGRPLRVLRALPGGEWLAFSERGILDASPGAGGTLG